MEKKINILVVDDDLDFIGELALVLDHSSIELKAADSLEIMFEQVNKLRPDVLVLDVGVEHDSVGKLTEILKSKSETHGIPILLLMGKHSINGMMYINGGQNYLLKPFHVEEFIQIIRKLTREHAPDFQTALLPAY